MWCLFKNELSFLVDSQGGVYLSQRNAFHASIDYLNHLFGERFEVDARTRSCIVTFVPTIAAFSVIHHLLPLSINAFNLSPTKYAT